MPSQPQRMPMGHQNRRSGLLHTHWDCAPFRSGHTDPVQKRPSKGEMLAEISQAMIQFEKEYMGRGPLEIRTYLVEDLVVVRLYGVLTKAEIQLVKSSDAERGRRLIKEVRIELLEKGRALLEAVVEGITGRKVVSLHTDISTVTGERVIIFSLSGAPDFDG